MFNNNIFGTDGPTMSMTLGPELKNSFDQKNL